MPGLDIDSHAMVVITMSGGQTAIVDTTMACFAPKPRILALGADATFLKHGVDPQEAALAAGDIDSAAEPPEHWGTLHRAEQVAPVTPIPGRWRSFYEQVADALTKWPALPLPASGRDGARVVKVLDAAFASAASGRIVAVAT
jgi:predicted dehydrogenase